MTASRLIIFANGLLPDHSAARALIEPGDALLAADGGLRHALALGLVPGAVVGDLDSLSPADQAQIESRGAILLAFPRDKDQTDLELALRHAVERGFRKVLVVGALGGRLDQTLANLALLTAPALAGLDVSLDDGIEAARFLRAGSAAPARAASRRIRGQAGDLVSLLPWSAEVTGVTTSGLRWGLSDEILHAHEARGVSNEMSCASASVRIRSGLLLVVHRRLRRASSPSP